MGKLAKQRKERCPMQWVLDQCDEIQLRTQMKNSGSDVAKELERKLKSGGRRGSSRRSWAVEGMDIEELRGQIIALAISQGYHGSKATVKEYGKTLKERMGVCHRSFFTIGRFTASVMASNTWARNMQKRKERLNEAETARKDRLPISEAVQKRYAPIVARKLNGSGVYINSEKISLSYAKPSKWQTEKDACYRHFVQFTVTSSGIQMKVSS